MVATGRVDWHDTGPMQAFGGFRFFYGGWSPA
jgi:hypothetical protein